MAEPKLDSTKRSSEARAHHFLPRCYLAGFTEDGTKSGRLWVTDFTRNRQWQSNPPNTARRRDHNRLSDPNVDPLLIENAFSNIESALAPLLKQLFKNPQHPTAEELSNLMYFIAIQFIRVPGYRPWLTGVFDSIQKDWLNKYLKTPKTWAAIRKQIDSTMSRASSYEEMLKFKRNVIDAGSYTISAENDWYLQKGFAAIHGIIIPALNKRCWGSHISPTGGFITSDNPVLMDGPKDKMLGFESAEIVAFPVTRRVFIYGTVEQVKDPHVNRKLIAHRNTLAMLHADEQVYSHTPDFCWLDENEKYQTDWRRFSKEKILQSVKE